MANTTPGLGPAFYVDTETTRLRRPYREGGRRIWEIGGTRVDPGGRECPLRIFIRIADLGLEELARHNPDTPLRIRVGKSFNPDGSVTAHDGNPVKFEGTWYDFLPQDVQDSLSIGGFHERHPERIGPDGDRIHLFSAADAAEALTAGPWLKPWIGPDGKPVKPTLVGMVTNFDDLGLDQLLHDADMIGDDEELWHYRLLCAANYAAGALGRNFPYDPEEITQTLKVDVSDLTAHRAFDDAVLARRLFEAARLHAQDR